MIFLLSDICLLNDVSLEQTLQTISFIKYPSAHCAMPTSPSALLSVRGNLQRKWDVQIVLLVIVINRVLLPPTGYTSSINGSSLDCLNLIVQSINSVSSTAAASTATTATPTPSQVQIQTSHHSHLHPHPHPHPHPHHHQSSHQQQQQITLNQK